MITGVLYSLQSCILSTLEIPSDFALNNAVYQVSFQRTGFISTPKDTVLGESPLILCFESDHCNLTNKFSTILCKISLF